MVFNYSIPSTIKILGEYTSVDGGYSIHWSMNNKFQLVNPSKNLNQLIDVNMGDFAWVLIKPEVELPDILSFHKDRIKDCSIALKVIQKKNKIHSLIDLDLDGFRSIEHLLADPLIKKRAYHVISENYRVGEAVKAIERKRFGRLGKLLKATHASLNTNFEMNFSSLNKIVTESSNFECHLGGRILTDNYFGYTLNLIEKDSFDEFKTALNFIMYKKHQMKFNCIIVESQEDIIH